MSTDKRAFESADRSIDQDTGLIAAQLEEAKAMLAEILGHALGSPYGYISALGEPRTRDIQRRMVALGIIEIVYQPGTFIEHRAPVMPCSDKPAEGATATRQPQGDADEADAAQASAGEASKAKQPSSSESLPLLNGFAASNHLLLFNGH